MSESGSLRSRNARRSAERHSAESRLQELEGESFSEALPEGFHATYSNASERHTLDFKRPPQRAGTYSCILLGSICGVLARKGLQSLTTYSGSFLEGVVWANFVACVVMGISVESNKIWALLVDDSEHKPIYASKAAIPLYVGVTTGFCGSCSSFSSFMLEMFTKGANLPPVLAYPTVGYGILSILEVLLAQLAISVSGFRFGAHITRAIERKCGSISIRIYRAFEVAAGLLGVLAYIVIIVLIATKNDGAWRSWTFACLFAPFGAYCRFWLAKLLNSRITNFPLGTYAANLIGSVLLATFTLLAKGRSEKNSSIPIVSGVLSCHVLTGLDDGFCGCLTTVSTFVVEICALQSFHSYLYGSISVCTSFVAMLLILGSYNWSVGFTAAVC